MPVASTRSTPSSAPTVGIGKRCSSSRPGSVITSAVASVMRDLRGHSVWAIVGPLAPTIAQTRSVGGELEVLDLLGVRLQEGELRELDRDPADGARVRERDRIVVADGEPPVEADVEAGAADLPPERQVLRHATFADQLLPGEEAHGT